MFEIKQLKLTKMNSLYIYFLYIGTDTKILKNRHILVVGCDENNLINLKEALNVIFAKSQENLL